MYLLAYVFVGCVCFLPFITSYFLTLYSCTSAHRSASGCVCVCVSVCLPTRPACFVSQQSADKNPVPAQLFSVCLPPQCLQLQASPSSPALLSSTSVHLTPSPSSPLSLSCYSMATVSLLFALDTLLTSSRTLQPFVDVKTENITLSDNTHSVTCFVSRGKQSQPENRLSQT